MRTSWEQLHQSIVLLAAGAVLCGGIADARAGRPIERGELFGAPNGAEELDLENFGLLPGWTEPVRILHRSDERLRSMAVFRLCQLIAPKPVEDDSAEEKPNFRVRLPKVREHTAAANATETDAPAAKQDPPIVEPAKGGPPKVPAIPPTFRPGTLDIRDRDLSERPSLLQPTTGSWLGDWGFAPIQAPAEPQVIPPPIPPVEPPIPAPPATAELPKPELFPTGDSPTEPFPIPWETSRGSGVTPPPEPEVKPEPEPKPEPEEPAELKLRRPTSTWDLAELEGPLFGTEEITEFGRQVSAAGSYSLRPHFSLSALYDGNVFLSEESQESDFIITASPGLTARIGNDRTPLYLTADYTMGAVFFTESSDENSLNHNATLQLDWRGARTTLGLRLGFNHDSGTSIDATDRVKRTSFSFGTNASFAYSEKVSFDFSADYRRSYYEDLIGSQDYGAQAYVNYHFSPKLSLGIGGGFTMTEVEEGRNQQSENISLQANWVATGKLTLGATLGVGFYQYDNGEDDSASPVASLRATYVATGKLTFSGEVGVGLNRFETDELSPTFSLGTTWSVWEGTVITLDTHRRVFSSVVFSDQNYTSTGVVLGLRQQLGIRFTAFVTVGYENLEYTSAAPGVDATRQDDYYFARFGLQWHAFSRCSFGVFYEFSENSSQGEDARSFRRDRTGIQVSVIF
jgi:hypothetical protein